MPFEDSNILTRRRKRRETNNKRGKRKRKRERERLRGRERAREREKKGEREQECREQSVILVPWAGMSVEGNGWWVSIRRSDDGNDDSALVGVEWERGGRSLVLKLT